VICKKHRKNLLMQMGLKFNKQNFTIIQPGQQFVRVFLWLLGHKTTIFKFINYIAGFSRLANTCYIR
jgi:hypothetical protein